VRLRIDVHAAVIEHLAKVVKEKVTTAYKANRLQPQDVAMLQEVERKQIESVRLARRGPAARGGQPDAAFRDLFVPLKWLQEADDAFDTGIASLKEAENALDRALARINGRLHSVDARVMKSDKTATRFGWVGVAIGVIGVVVGLVGVLIAM
jgi:hypothetical protein